MDEECPEGPGAPSRLVVVAHRAPVQFDRDDAGERIVRRAGGGLVSAFLSTLPTVDRARFDPLWIAAAATEEDHAVARENPGGLIEVPESAPCPVRLLELDADEHDRFYASFSNPMLWFIQHELWGFATEPVVGRAELAAYTHGYVPVNRRFAEAVCEHVADGAGARPVVMVQDYHFYLVPGTVREAHPHAAIHTFVHVPWPQPDAWRVLPADVREQLLRGLLGSDVVGFHTRRFARNFLLSCQELLDLRVDLHTMTVETAGRTVAATWSPISVDVEQLRGRAQEDDARSELASLRRRRRNHLIVRVDRSDPSKNLIRGFLAFDLLLEQRPELAGRVTFLAVVPPSRQDVPQYRSYLLEVEETVAAVNERHGTESWQPIELRVEENLPLALAAYHEYDALLVNSVADGLNLVAKEGIILNRRGGALVLSENAGVHEELGAFSLAVNPFDIVAQAGALHEALTMDPTRRRDLHDASLAIVEHHDAARWLQQQLDVLARHLGTRP